MSSMSSASSASSTRTALATLTGLVAALLVLVTPTAAHAAGTTYTWNGHVNDLWATPDNWSPAGVPGNGDSVVLTSVPGKASTRISQVPVVTLADLAVHEGGGDVRLGDGPNGTGAVTVAHGFDWTGGDLGLPVTIAPGATGTVRAGAPKDLDGGDLTVQGSLTLENIGDSDDQRVMTWWEHRIVVAAGGTLTSHGVNQVSSQRCCGAGFPGALENHGTVAVPDGRLALLRIELDQQGALNVAAGATVSLGKGLARLGPATYAGGGSLELVDTAAPDPDAAHPDQNQGGALLLGTNTLADGFRLVVGSGAELTGVGRFDGSGALVLGGGIVYADVALAPGIRLDTLAGSASEIGVWDADAAGYHGQLTLAGDGLVAAGSALSLTPGSQTVVGRGGWLQVPAGGRIDARSCCTDDPALVTDAGGLLGFGGGTGPAALLKWITLANRGTVRIDGETTWDRATVSFAAGSRLTGSGTLHGDVHNGAATLAPTGRLTVDGDYAAGRSARLVVPVSGGHHPATDGRLAVTGTALLAGTLTTTGPAARVPGRSATVLTARRIDGAFGCARGRGWLPSSTARAVKLTAVGVKVPGCAHATHASKRMNGTVRHHPTRFRAKVPHRARRVLLEITAKHPSRTTRLTVAAKGGGHARLRVRRGHRVHRYVAVRVGKKHAFTVRTGAGKARVKVVVRGWYR